MNLQLPSTVTLSGSAETSALRIRSASSSSHHLRDPHDGGGGPRVHVNDPGKVADDEVDPGAARKAQGVKCIRPARRDGAVAFGRGEHSISASGAAPPSPGAKTPGL